MSHPRAWRLVDTLTLALIVFMLGAGVWEHHSTQSENRRTILGHSENRLAIITLARAQCGTDGGRAQINEALRTLGAKPC